MPDTLEKSPPGSLAQSSQEAPAPLVAIALSGDGYWRRIWGSIVWQTEEYVKKDFAYSCAVGIFLGFLTLLDGSATLTTLYWSVIGFFAVFGARLAAHVVTALSLTDAIINKALETSDRRLTELTKEKLIFEVDERGSRIYVQEHPNQPLIVTAHIKMRFRNKDIYPTHVRKIHVTLCEKQEDETIREVFTLLRIGYSMNGVEIKVEDFEGMMIQEKRMTPSYIVEAWLCFADEIETAAELTWNHFLRVTMEAADQDLVERDFYLNWQDAIKEGGTPLVQLRRPSIDTRSFRMN